MIGRLYILCLASLFSSVTFSQNLQSQWQTLYQNLWQKTPLTLSQNEISEYPNALWMDASRYPTFDNIDWHDLRTLNNVATQCRPVEQTNNALQPAIVFELALCRGTSLSEDWFATNDVLHPAGGSYADRYLANRGKLAQSSSNKILRFTSISNPLNPLHHKLSSLSESGKEALINGYRAWMEDDTLWLSGESGWKAVPTNIWHPLVKEANITLQGDSCAFTYSNLCISKKQPLGVSIQVLLLFLGSVLLAFLLRLSYLKHKQRKEKRFILQLLTHELRTPITSLGLTIDMFRHHFDSLDDDVQDVFWRLVSDYQRLSQLTQNSKAYLSAEKSNALLSQTAPLDDWLSHYCDKNEVKYTLNKDDEIGLPYYWLAICLENLIRNAKQHGRGEITVTAHLATTLVIEVKDEGEFPTLWQKIFHQRKVMTSNDNMGIGLDIVEHLMQMANGKLTILRNPTRCILELPYEHNSTD